MSKLAIHSLNAARRIYSRRKPSASSFPYFFCFEDESSFPAPDYQGDQVGDYIKQLMLRDQPCMVCRLGSVELAILLTHLNIVDSSSLLRKAIHYIKGKKGWFFSHYAKREMSQNAGIFPATDDILHKFSERMFDDLHHIDVLGSWLFDESWLQKKYFPNAIRVPLADLEPYYHRNPWTEALAGRTVLVIHPFVESIRQQYAKRHLLFKDRRVLPDFELKTIKAVQSVADNPTRFSNWFEALDSMCEQIAHTSFDVAIIGAGAYGLPLASFVKRIGKKSVHLGGASQILFGIRGKKWDELPFFQRLFNEHWVRPTALETPVNSHKVEGGIYW